MSKRIPSTNDISEQTKEEFSHPDDDVEAIEVNSEKEAENELENLIKFIDERQEWDVQTNYILRGMGLVKGGALEYPSFKKGLISLYNGLISAATNLRSTLLKRACLFITQLSKECGSSFELLGDFIGPLSAMLGHGTQIIADSMKYSILNIVTNSPSKKILFSIVDLSNSKGVSQRMVASESISIICNTWSSDLIDSSFDKIQNTIIKLLSDASAEVRLFARGAVRNLMQTNPEKSQQILGKLDEKLKNQIETAEPTPRTETPVYKRVQRTTPREINTQPDQKDLIKQNKELLKEQQKQKLQEFAKQKQNKEQPKDRSETPKKIIKTPATKSSIPVLHKMDERPARSASVKSTRSRVKLENLPEPTEKNDKNKSVQKAMKRHQSYKNVPNSNAKESKIPKREETKESANIEPKEQQNKPETKLQKQNLMKKDFSFDGDEKKYLNKVKMEIKSGHIEDLRDDIATIGTTVLQCCLSKNTEIQKNAFSILFDLLQNFADCFSNVLPKIVTLLLKTSKGQNRDLNKICREIMGNIPNFFPPQDVINAIMDQNSLSTEILIIASSLAKSTSLTEKDIVNRLLLICVDASKSREVEIRHLSGEIVQRIYENSKHLFEAFVSNISPSDKESFMNFVNSYIPGTARSTQSANVDLPKYNERNHEKYLKELQKFCDQHESLGDYNEIYSAVFNTLSELLEKGKDQLFTLQAVANIIKKHGIRGFDLILNQILLFQDCQQKDNVLAAVCGLTNGTRDFMSNLCSILSEDSATELANQSMRMMARLITSTKEDEFSSLVNLISKAAKTGINSESSAVRKSTVLCLVELKVKNEEIGDNVINQLLPQQQKLVAIYYQKR